MASNIRVTFYTPSDDFSYKQSVDDAREWLRSRGKVKSYIHKPDGTVVDGPSLDDIDDDEVARWYAAASLGEVRRKATDGKVGTSEPSTMSGC